MSALQFYIDSANFSTATTVYLDSLLTDVAPDGYYSLQGYYRRQVDGALTDVASCPIIDTVSVTAVGETTATFNGNFINNGGDVNAVRGFVYGTSPNPTTANSVITDTVRAQGAYSLNVTGLASVVQYYVRAYSIVFGETIYGDQLNFTTVVIVPCGATTEAGGRGIEDLNVSLNSIGGVIVFLLEPYGFVDKLEIYHGLPQNEGVNKKATTSQSAINTYTLTVNTLVSASVGDIYSSTSGASYTVYTTKISGTGTSLIVTCPTFTTPITALTKISGTGDSSIDFTLSTQTYGGNYGPFDNVWGTPSSNLEPDDTDLPVDQFIGTDKGAVPTRQAEFTADTGFTIPNMTIGGVTYNQIIWWKYTAADYLVNSVANIRITGGSFDTQWKTLRLCF
jgi:hypothetical protein